MDDDEDCYYDEKVGKFDDDDDDFNVECNAERNDDYALEEIVEGLNRSCPLRIKSVNLN